ncbi:MAG: polymer-forming cytoskeletal protein [Sulfurospirillum sp.]
MGVFNKHDQQSISSSETTIIAKGAKINGILNCETRLHIDGEVEGEIVSKSIVTIGNKGRFYGKIKAAKLILNGFLEGSADCGSIELLGGSIFNGQTTSKELMIEAKATFDGQSIMKQDKKIEKEEV